MSIREVINYRATCDRCGQDGYSTCDSQQDLEVFLTTDGWTIGDGGMVCSGCHKIDEQEACRSDTGHMWDTSGNSRLASLWTGDPDGQYRLRYCGLCHRMERQNRGEEWLGYDSHGRWLGSRETTDA